ncbi:MAG: glycine--tRNA ligase subunit alpha, partial [Elusimicrobia bacterium]|nr:glycine--tRNA ligase subunit alpha [Elusimicrobiota bacterium]
MKLTLQDTIMSLERFWAREGCLIAQPYDLEKGAGTFNPATFFGALTKAPTRAAYVEPCRRPADGRYGDNPNRLAKYFQYQVILKPAPSDVQQLYLRSLAAIGLEP